MDDFLSHLALGLFLYYLLACAIPAAIVRLRDASGASWVFLGALALAWTVVGWFAILILSFILPRRETR